MLSLSATERKQLNEKLSSIVSKHVPELKKDNMDKCGYRLINDEVDTSGLTLVTKESSASAFDFMYKVFGDDLFLTK